MGIVSPYTLAQKRGHDLDEEIAETKRAIENGWTPPAAPGGTPVGGPLSSPLGTPAIESVLREYGIWN
jgi:hypothetical protein